MISYALTVVETGLPAGTQWTFTFDGSAHNLTVNSTTIAVSHGTFAFSASAPPGYTVSSPSSVTINYSNATVTVAFSKTSSSSSIYTGLGIGGAIGVIIGVPGAMFYSGNGPFSRKKTGKPNSCISNQFIVILWITGKRSSSGLAVPVKND